MAYRNKFIVSQFLRDRNFGTVWLGGSGSESLRLWARAALIRRRDCGCKSHFQAYLVGDGQEASAPCYGGFSIGHLSVLTTWPLASPTVSDCRERERDKRRERDVLHDLISKVTHHCFCILFVGSKSLSPVHTQSERLGSSLAGKSIKEFVGSF